MLLHISYNTIQALLDPALSNPCILYNRERPFWYDDKLIAFAENGWKKTKVWKRWDGSLYLTEENFSSNKE
jgi:hypothetical protein